MTREIFENAVIFKGPDLKPIEGYMLIEDGIIKEIGRGIPKKRGKDLKKSFVIPPFVNAHTHIADSVQKDLYECKSQTEVVGPKGEKFSALKSCSDEAKIKAIKNTLTEMKKSGTMAHCDFREGGMKGARILRRSIDKQVTTLILSRPSESAEIDELVKETEGIGIPSLDSFSEQEIKRISKKVTNSKKLLSFHVSETQVAHKKSIKETNKTEIERALSFSPTHLIHGTWASESDLELMKEASVPLVLCPRSNSLLCCGIPPIKKALEKGVEIWLGTDNVTVCSPIMFEELSFTWSMLRYQSKDAGKKEAKELLKAATINPTKKLNLEFGPIDEGKKAYFLTLERKPNLSNLRDPHIGIVNRARMDNVKMVYYPKKGRS